MLLRRFAAAALCMLGWASAAQAAEVDIAHISGIIGVASVRQLSRAIERAKFDNAQALIVELDTPGGLVSSGRKMVQQIVASPVPVVVYVAPAGARAASAGTLLVYAAHIAAMAPGTNLGAATPILMGGFPGLSPSSDKDKKAKSPESTEERKASNDIVALLRSLAQLRGRNVDFAEKAVTEAATMTANEALKAGVIDVEASKVGDLLAAIDGRKVTAGTVRTLATKDAKLVTLEPDLRTRLLSTISDPNVAFLLLMIGFYGLILEFWHPGVFAPGVIGAISLILALIGLTALPVNYGALGLIVLGIALMIGEVFVPGTMALGIGGLIAFVVGAYFLFESAGNTFGIAVSLPLIFSMAATTALLIFGIVAAAVQARRKPAVSGAEQVIGGGAQVIDWHGEVGHVRFNGEIWSARAKRPLEPGAAVRIAGREGLTLIVDS